MDGLATRHAWQAVFTRVSAGVLAVFCAWVTCGPARAETHEYVIDIPDRHNASFEIRFEVEHQGEVSVSADWSGPRVLSFRLEGPGARAHSAGPSPQRLRIDVTDEILSLGGAWTLDIRAIPARGKAEGSVTLALPGPPLPAEPPPPPTPPDPEPPRDPWMIPREAPAGVSREVLRVFEAVETLRASVVTDDGRLAPDPCGWQPTLLRWASMRRERAAEGTGPADLDTGRYLLRLADVVREVEDLKDSSDPILRGPEPERASERRAWRRARRERIRPLERGLDELREMLRRGYAPELETEEWPVRFIACLTACERHFEQRAYLGEEAPNSELAAEPWDRLLAAAGVLEALCALDADRTGVGADTP